MPKSRRVHRADMVAAPGRSRPGLEHGGPGLVGESLERRRYPSGYSARARAPRVLLVDGLAGNAEDLRDLLPGPAAGPCVVYLERLELLQQAAEGGDGAQPG